MIAGKLASYLSHDPSQPLSSGSKRNNPDFLTLTWCHCKGREFVPVRTAPRRPSPLRVRTKAHGVFLGSEIQPCQKAALGCYLVRSLACNLVVIVESLKRGISLSHPKSESAFSLSHPTVFATFCGLGWGGGEFGACLLTSGRMGGGGVVAVEQTFERCLRPGWKKLKWQAAGVELIFGEGGVWGLGFGGFLRNRTPPPKKMGRNMFKGYRQKKNEPPIR